MSFAVLYGFTGACVALGIVTEIALLRTRRNRRRVRRKYIQPILFR